MATKRLKVRDPERDKYAARAITRDLCAAGERRGIPAFEIACRIAEAMVGRNAILGKKVLIGILAELTAPAEQ